MNNIIKSPFWRRLSSLLLLCIYISVFGQNRTITGTITDEQNETIPGVNITIKGTTIGVVSNIEGKYSITAPSGDVTLSFSFLGYTTQDVIAGDNKVINVKMAEAIYELKDIVVIGYGTQKKTTLTGAVVAIENKEIITTKSTNVTNSLTGKMAGVKVVQGSSEPGDFSQDNFNIRGMGTPLFVIDGVPRENMTRLDPNEIESVSILKDASAAIYGTRAANGVVLVTTKKGEKNAQFKFEYTGYVGTERFINDVQALDAIGYMQLVNEKNFNGGRTDVLYGKRSFEPYINGTKQSSDWVNEFVNPYPLEMHHSINATGGSDKINYFVNFGYVDQQGRWITKDANYERFNARSNVSAEIAQGLRAEVLLNLTQGQQRMQSMKSWRIFNNTWEMYPTDPIYLPDPVTGAASKDYLYFNQFTHPGAVIDADISGYDLTSQSLVQSNFSLEWDLPWVKKLKVKGMYSYDFTDEDVKQFRKQYNRYDQYYKPISSADQFVRRENHKKINVLLQLQLSYEKTIAHNHNLSVMALYEESSRRADNFWVRRDVLISSVEELFAGSKTNIQGNQESDNVYHFTNKGVVGRLNYDYASKYLATFSFRYDGSSMFGSGHQWGFFPVGSVGWRLSEESFMKDNTYLDVIDNLKIRASYGIVGDDTTSAYQWLTGYTYPAGDQYYVLDGEPVPGMLSKGVPNALITWATSHTVDVGVDFELWKGLLGGMVDVYQRDRKGLLAKRLTTLPNEAGLTLPDENINSDRTQGVELTLTHRNKIRDFRYNASGYFTIDRNKTKYVERGPSTSSMKNWRQNTTNRLQNFVWGYDYQGQFQSLDDIYNNSVTYDGQGNIHMLPGDLIYGDWNEDGVIDDNDTHPISIAYPMVSYGFTIGAEYKGFDLNTTLQGSALNRKRLGNITPNFEQPVRPNASGLMVFKDRWRRTDEFNPSIDQEWIPGYYPSNYTDNKRDFVLAASNFWLVNLSYIRLKTIELGYTLPRRITQKAGMDKVRIFFNGYNLFTLSEIKITDPEQSSQYPLNKSFNLGLNLLF
jgi:TonB-linked SusC/RagA family outer membrane protein